MKRDPPGSRTRSSGAKTVSPSRASSGATTRAGAAARKASKTSLSSASDPYVAWWSSSMFSTTATSASSASIDLSDSSASTTSQSPCAPVGVLARRPQRAADQVARLRPGAQQRVGDHRGRRGLAVRAGDRDDLLQRRQLTQQLGPRQRARDPLRVVGRDRGRDEDVGAVRDVGGVVAHVHRRRRARAASPAPATPRGPSR